MPTFDPKKIQAEKAANPFSKLASAPALTSLATLSNALSNARKITRDLDLIQARDKAAIENSRLTFEGQLESLPEEARKGATAAFTAAQKAKRDSILQASAAARANALAELRRYADAIELARGLNNPLALASRHDDAKRADYMRLHATAGVTELYRLAQTAAAMKDRSLAAAVISLSAAHGKESLFKREDLAAALWSDETRTMDAIGFELEHVASRAQLNDAQHVESPRTSDYKLSHGARFPSKDVEAATAFLPDALKPDAKPNPIDRFQVTLDRAGQTLDSIKSAPFDESEFNRQFDEMLARNGMSPDAIAALQAMRKTESTQQSQQQAAA